ncbi:methyl-accepting chemotaxis protein [Noviherbaspirillum sp. CPCC 100848]|uniref:Methyl-accepting chemotaxis protein n=1 Tax=Noviherbaspirillum album TaxID=3080276 RepID=A0ABU6JFK3_9BURK|nr:methyl-accepting chemotaxis protein [Noviherbaspirillum sp. CPCC 100848]MEC4722450.1 methyl-accepting chemotaxis protein [Noviherbaspirillum sp. CPCC 100848]
MKLTNLNVGARLAMAFGLVLALMAILVVVGLTRFESIGVTSAQLVDKDWVKAEAANVITATTRANARRTMELLIVNDRNQRDTIKQKIEENKKTITDAIEQLDRLVTQPEGKALLARIKEQRKVYVASFGRIAALVEETDYSEARNLMVGETLPALDALQESVNALNALQKKVVEQSGVHVMESVRFGQMIFIAIGVGAVLAGIALAILLSRSITGPLNHAVDIARTVAAGDLTSRIEVKTKDETGRLLQALREMNDSLLRIVAQVRSGTDTIAGASTQIAAGNLDLSSRTEEQASTLEETASSMEELTSTVRQNADNARQADKLAQSASEVANRGGMVVSQVVETMGSINASSKKISDIISVIDGIAFQTNILALNAAVEAARAGEQGRGFAVVATEVRSLAQRSAAAAKEIKVLIDDSVEKVATGAKLVDQAGATMSEIVDSVQRVTDIMAEITAASDEQSAGIEQVNQAIAQMDEVTQQNASLVEQAAAAADAMQEQARGLQQAVGTFKVDGSAAPAVAVMPMVAAVPVKAATRPLAAGMPQMSVPAAGTVQTTAPKLPAGSRGKALAKPQHASTEEWEEF